MKIIRSFQYLDFVLQLLLVTMTILPLFAGGLPISLFGLFLLGCWQLFSAIVLGAGLKDRFRKLYLVAALSFCWIAFSVGCIIDEVGLAGWSSILKSYFWVVLIISFIAGLQYFAYTLRTHS